MNEFRLSLRRAKRRQSGQNPGGATSCERIRIRVHVSEDHEVRITLPSDFPAGEAEVIVIGAEPEGIEALPKLTVDELLAARLSPPPGVGAVTLADMEKAVADGASGGGGA